MSAETKPVDVLTLAARAGIHVGATANIIFTADAPPMMRRLTIVEVRHQYGNDWLHWQWDRAGQTPWGTNDCGFAGNVIDDDLIHELRRMAAALEATP